MTDRRGIPRWPGKSWEESKKSGRKVMGFVLLGENLSPQLLMQFYLLLVSTAAIRDGSSQEFRMLYPLTKAHFDADNLPGKLHGIVLSGNWRPWRADVHCSFFSRFLLVLRFIRNSFRCVRTVVVIVDIARETKMCVCVKCCVAFWSWNSLLPLCPWQLQPSRTNTCAWQHTNQTLNLILTLTLLLNSTQ